MEPKVVSDPITLYLELMKKTLCFLLWDEPGQPLEIFNYRRPAYKRLPINAISNLLGRADVQLVRVYEANEELRQQGKVWPLLAHTMLGLDRLDNIQYCVETVIKDGINGDLIEAGVWRGGACIFMRAILAVRGITDRRVFVADSFAGLPEPNAAFPQDKGDKHHTQDFLAVSEDDVKDNFRKYGLLDDQVAFLKGWFKDTLPNAPIEHLSVMRVDADMYESTIDVLVNLYPKLSEGGFCIIDDYDLKGCRAAVDDFREQNMIKAPIEHVQNAVFWRK